MIDGGEDFGGFCFEVGEVVVLLLYQVLEFDVGMMGFFWCCGVFVFELVDFFVQGEQCFQCFCWYVFGDVEWFDVQCLECLIFYCLFQGDFDSVVFIEWFFFQESIDCDIESVGDCLQLCQFWFVFVCFDYGYLIWCVIDC